MTFFKFFLQKDWYDHWIDLQMHVHASYSCNNFNAPPWLMFQLLYKIHLGDRISFVVNLRILLVYKQQFHKKKHASKGNEVCCGAGCSYSKVSQRWTICCLTCCYRRFRSRKNSSNRTLQTAEMFNVFQVLCPGTYLRDYGYVYLRVYCMGLEVSTKAVPPTFPLFFHERLRFERVF